MRTLSGTRLGTRGWWPDSRLGLRAVAFAGISLTGIVLLVLGITLDTVELADGYTDSWAQTAWGAGIWASAVAAFITGLIAMTRHNETVPAGRARHRPRTPARRPSGLGDRAGQVLTPAVP